MDLYQKCLILTAGISIAVGDFRYEHYKTFSFHGNDNPSRKPWFLDDYSDYKPESSGIVSHYAYPYDNEKHGSIHIPTYKEYSPYTSSDSYFSSTKKIPKEDKNFKKAIYPFYTITDKDSAKYKELVLKSGLPYCQEIKSKKVEDLKIKADDSKSTEHSKSEDNSKSDESKSYDDSKSDDDSKRIRREAMTCYRCKDPKNGSTYEHCSYSSQPEASSKIERFEHGPLRLRRSNEEFDSVEEESAPPALSVSENRDGKLKEPYRFSDEYFLPQATHKLSTEHKTDLCERVVKDSMVCMVCKDPKTSGKYEQCSYVANPDDKAYAYSKSSSFGKPEKSGKGGNAEKSGNLKKRDYRRPAPTRESLESSEYADVSEEKPRQVKDATGDSECKQVQRDSEICTVCKDPKTGGNSERCSYAYNPDDKVYKFTRSKSFGYPESSEASDKGSSYENDESDKEVSESDPKESTSYSDDDSGYDGYSGYQQKKKPKEGSSYESQESPSSYGSDGSDESKESQAYDYSPADADYIRSESEKILKDAESTNCKKVQKDSMICTVCKDPKTGGNSESCTYSYQPNDKKFAYTKSKSFGNPTESRGESKEGGSGEGNPYSSEYSDDGGYGYASEYKPVAYQGRKQVAADSKSLGVVSNPGATQAPVSKVDLEFLGTSKRKEEIEKFLKEFQAEDRTKCQKVMKDKMTCYQCEDENGVKREECVFITAPENKNKTQVSYRESKEFKVDAKPEAAASVDILKKKNVEKNKEVLLEPTASASEDSYIRKKESKKKNDDKDEDDDVDENDDQDGESYGESNDYKDDKDDKDENDHKDQKYDKDSHPKTAEPYEYVAETKYKYDKVLGLSLPAYMLEASEFEKEFDDIYSGGSSSS